MIPLRPMEAAAALGLESLPMPGGRGIDRQSFFAAW